MYLANGLEVMLIGVVLALHYYNKILETANFIKRKSLLSSQF
jgi:hypothetical protein